MSHRSISSLCVSTSKNGDYSGTKAKQYSFKLSTQSNYSCSEILFDLFPSIFMPYLDVDTFCNLLKTEVWDWHYLLSDRIIFDYMSYISDRNQQKIAKFCSLSSSPLQLSLDSSSESYDSSDSMDYNAQIEHGKDFNVTDDEEQQNFAIINIMIDDKHKINPHFVLTHFRDIDVIHDTMLGSYLEIGLTSNLCKHLKIERYPNANSWHLDQENIFAYDCYHDLCQDLQSRNCYNNQDIDHVEHVLLKDILTMCTDKWYFVEWESYDEVKQMIIAHFDDNKYSKIVKKYDHNVNSELFAVWAIEWHQTNTY